MAKVKTAKSDAKSKSTLRAPKIKATNPIVGKAAAVQKRVKKK